MSGDGQVWGGQSGSDELAQVDDELDELEACEDDPDVEE